MRHQEREREKEESIRMRDTAVENNVISIFVAFFSQSHRHNEIYFTIYRVT